MRGRGPPSPCGGARPPTDARQPAGLRSRRCRRETRRRSRARGRARRRGRRRAPRRGARGSLARCRSEGRRPRVASLDLDGWARPMIGRWLARCSPNGDLADRFDLLADLSELLGEEGFRVQAYRRAAARLRETGASVAELALAGDAKKLPGIGKTIEAKIVEVVETGDMEALAKRREAVPPGVVAFLRVPGLGPKTAARIWHELDVTTLAALREAAEEGRLRALPGLGARSEQKILAALRQGVADAGPKRGLLGVGLPVVRAAVEALREHPAAVDVSEAGSARRRRETFRDLDVIATATDPAALTALLRRPALGARGGGARRHEGDGRHAAGPPHRPARRAAGELRRPAPALHRIQGAQRRAARGRGAPRALGVGVRRHRDCHGRRAPLSRRGVALRVPRVRVHPAGAARERRRARGRA